MRIMTPPPQTDDFDRLYRQEYAPLVRLAWTLTGRWAVAEELVQEAFLRAHRRWDTIGTYQRPGAWVRRILLNLATSRARRMAAEARALVRLTGRQLDDEPSADADPELW